MHTKAIAHRAELTGTAYSRTVFSFDFIEAEDGSILAEGLQVEHDREKEAFIRWFGIHENSLMKQFNTLMSINGIEVRKHEHSYGLFVTRVSDWDPVYTWYHLVENSLQSFGPRSVWRVSTNILLTDTHVVLEVDDNGCGISRSRLKEVFLTDTDLYDGKKNKRERRRGFRFGGHGKTMRRFLDDVAREQRNPRRRHPLYVEVTTNCKGEKSTCTIRTGGVTVNADGKKSVGTRVRVFYPRESFVAS